MLRMRLGIAVAEVALVLRYISFLTTSECCLFSAVHVLFILDSGSSENEVF